MCAIIEMLMAFDSLVTTGFFADSESVVKMLRYHPGSVFWRRESRKGYRFVSMYTALCRLLSVRFMKHKPRSHLKEWKCATAQAVSRWVPFTVAPGSIQGHVGFMVDKVTLKPVSPTNPHSTNCSIH
jgi:hypothetical protein